MRAVVITKAGDPSVLKVEQRPDPSPPGSGQVLIEVRAAGVNFADTMARVGLYEDAPPLPAVVGYEVAGVITAVGTAGTRFGGYAEQVVVAEGAAIPLADGLSFEQGAAIPVNYATAWAGLLGFGSLQAGERVLVHAAAGGVGIAALQIAKAHGAEVHGTASPGKHARLAELGIDRAIDYRQRGWQKGLPSYDVIMDAVGGSSFRKSYNLLRPGGRLVAYGASSVTRGETRSIRQALPQAARMFRGFNLIDQMGASKAVIGLNMLRLWDDRGTLEPWIRPLDALLAGGEIAPVVHAAVPFADAPEAHRIIAARENVGKVVLVP
jgi:NADPH:quinone reductase-like Zn-dependent oxidoreductase